jgi:hypothetical protein
MSLNMISLEIFNELIVALYDAANDDAQWNHFLALLASAFNGHGASIRLVNSQSFCPH